jgi:hypothetical protein
VTSYSIDTSAILDGWVRHYPIDTFPALWDRLDQLIDAGRLCTSDEVLRELEMKDDDALAWAKARPSLFVALDEPVQVATTEILALFPKLVDTMKGRNRADPFVIAVAKLKGLTVVTGEKGGQASRPRIPFVCEHLAVPCLDLIGLIRAERWVFR